MVESRMVFLPEGLAGGAGLPDWDLADLYASPDDPKIAADSTAVAEGAKAFAARYQGKLAGLSGAELAAAVGEY